MIINKHSGFTIVELLIVIVVIGVLGALIINAFSSAQVQAKNTKTHDAAKAWVKIFKTYAAEKSQFPSSPARACLGQDYPYGINEGAATTEGQCRGDADKDKVNSSLLSELRPYYNGDPPTPDFQVISTSTTNWYRGILMFSNSSTSSTIGFVQKNTSTCPPIGGAVVSTHASVSGSVFCRAYIVAN